MFPLLGVDVRESEGQSNQTVDQNTKQREKKTLQMVDTKNEGSKLAGPAGQVARSSTAQQQQQQQQHEKPRRVIKPCNQHASSLETADDDEYDDCWDPYFVYNGPTTFRIPSSAVNISTPESVEISHNRFG
ncbi:hypothetical protein CLIM01_03476 [Colletotrichum limetticola]|uniref:Uncharacterized protein n=1 Tax=Colletotrichum limetticola TaxID=1209924 RepID=A0ABQ9Q650_9PEZI|nr:hypothetical protein CLIM01_03476 [Colletotrichum limetticola]